MLHVAEAESRWANRSNFAYSAVRAHVVAGVTLSLQQPPLPAYRHRCSNHNGTKGQLAPVLTYLLHILRNWYIIMRVPVIAYDWTLIYIKITKINSKFGNDAAKAQTKEQMNSVGGWDSD